MIIGAKYFNDKNNWYVQTNNPTEEMLRKTGNKGFLESCGSTTAINCLAPLGYNVEIVCPGSYKPQPEEVLTDWFNDPGNYSKMRRARGNMNPASIPGNRVPQYYEPAVWDVFGVQCKFAWISSNKQIVEYLSKDCAVQVCLKKPGHYIAIVAFDMDKQEFIYNDSWPGRIKTKMGFNDRFKLNYNNLHNFIIVYPKKEQM